MNTPQVGYTCSQAASMAVSRLEKCITKGTSKYEAVRDFYLKSFSHYANMCSTVLVGKKRLLPNSFVEAMISYWGNCDREERQRLTPEAIEEIMEDAPAFIAKTSKTYSQIITAEILQVSRQTVIHWMNKGWMDYILIGDARRPLKIEVDKMVKYAVQGKKKEDYTRYKEYFVRKGVWQEQQGISTRLTTSESLKKKCSDLKTTIGELGKKVKNAERALIVSEKNRTKLATELEAVKGRYETATSENKAANKRIGQLETQLEELQEQYESTETEKSNLSKLLSVANKNISDLNAQVQRLNEQNQRTEERYKALSEKLREKKREIDKLNDDVENLGKENTRLEQQYDALLSDSKALRGDLAIATQQRIDDLEAEVERLQQQNFELEQQNETLQEQNDGLSSKIEAYEAEAKKVKKDTKTGKKARYGPSEQGDTGLIAKIQELHEQNLALTKDIESLRAQLKAGRQKGKKGFRIYCVDETYEVGERIKHPIWAVEGRVISSSGNQIEVDFGDEEYGKKTLIQGKKP